MKKLLVLIISLGFSCDLFSQIIQPDSLFSELVFNYVYTRDYDKLSSVSSEINANDTLKRYILLELTAYLLDKSNFECENLIPKKYNTLIHDTIIKTELLDLSKNWRLKKELIIMLINDVYNGQIRKNEYLNLCIESKCLVTIKSKKESRRLKKNCTYFIIERIENLEILEKSIISIRKWSKELRRLTCCDINFLGQPLKYSSVVVM